MARPQYPQNQFPTGLISPILLTPMREKSFPRFYTSRLTLWVNFNIFYSVVTHKFEHFMKIVTKALQKCHCGCLNSPLKAVNRQ